MALPGMTRGQADQRYGHRLGNRWAALGDSLIAGGVSGNTLGQAWPLWFQALAGGRLQIAAFSGNPGKRTDEINAFIPTILATNAKVCLYGGGTNDILQSVAQATIRANLDAGVRQLRAGGVAPVMVTVPPNNTSTYKTAICQLNAWIRLYAAANRIPLVDFYNLLVDPSNAQYLSTYANDGTHPNNAGYLAMAQLAYNSLSSVLPSGAGLLSRLNADPLNLITANACFLTDGNADGIPDSWTAYSVGASTGVTHSIVTGDTSIVGNWAQMACSSSASDRVLEFNCTTNIVAGNKVAIAGLLGASGYSSGNGGTVKVVFTGGSLTVYPAYQWRQNVAGYYYQEVTIPTGTTGIVIDLICGAGTGTYKLAQPVITDLTAQGLATI